MKRVSTISISIFIIALTGCSMNRHGGNEITYNNVQYDKNYVAYGKIVKKKTKKRKYKKRVIKKSHKKRKKIHKKTVKITKKSENIRKKKYKKKVINLNLKKSINTSSVIKGKYKSKYIYKKRKIALYKRNKHRRYKLRVEPFSIKSKKRDPELLGPQTTLKNKTLTKIEKRYRSATTNKM